MASVKFENPSTCIIAGPSSSGKSTFVYNVLKNAGQLFKDPPKRIYFCFNVNQPLYEDMKRDIPEIEFFEGIPTKEVLETWLMQEPGHKMLILDDLMSEASTSTSISDVFCKYSHHMHYSCWLIVQNLFNGGKLFRTISLNSHYFIIFKNRRDEMQVRTLGRQIFGGDVNYYLQAYKMATDVRYGYILIDLSSHSNPLYKLRSNIIPPQYTSVYLPEKALP